MVRVGILASRFPGAATEARSHRTGIPGERKFRAALASFRRTASTSEICRGGIMRGAVRLAGLARLATAVTACVDGRRIRRERSGGERIVAQGRELYGKRQGRAAGKAA